MSTLLSRRSSVTIADVFRLLLLERFSGSVTLHFSNGTPQRVEYGRPNQLPIHTDHAPDAPKQMEVVDNRMTVSSR